MTGGRNKFIWIALACFCFLHPLFLSSQVNFSFDYVGPDTLYVGNNCTAVLDWGHPTSLFASCTAQGQTCEITSLSIVDITGNFEIGDDIPPGEEVMVTYRATSSVNAETEDYVLILYTKDTLAPSFDVPDDATLSCDQQTIPAFTGTVFNLLDNCTNVDTNFIDIIIQGRCPQSYTIQREWTATDEYGNKSLAKVQNIEVMDDEPPRFILEPADLVVECSSITAIQSSYNVWLANFGGSLSADNCSNSGRLTRFIAKPGSYDILNPSTYPGLPPDTLEFGDCPGPDLGVYISKTFDFVVYDECGNATSETASFLVLDNTAPEIACPSDILVFSQPNQCDVLVELPPPGVSENCLSSSEWEYTYTLVGELPVSFVPTDKLELSFSSGIHDVLYTVTNCTGRTSSCTFSIEIRDQSSPDLQCPSDMTIALDAGDNCSQGKPVLLPLAEVNDNCPPENFEQVQPLTQEDSWILFNGSSLMAMNKEYRFQGVAGEAIAEVELIYHWQGKIDNAQSYFVLRGEDGTVLGNTAIGQPDQLFESGDCTNDTLPAMLTGRIEIAQNQYNTWASDGVFEIQLEAVNVSPLCDILDAGSAGSLPDSISFINLSIRVPKADMRFRVQGATSLPFTAVSRPQGRPIPSLFLGSNEIQYQISDASGNFSSCGFTVQVVDELAPEPFCENIVLELFPDGSSVSQIDPDDLDGGSTDNCGISDRRVIISDPISCGQAGSTINTWLLVSDDFGNEDSCIAQVQVAVVSPEPSYIKGICDNADLLLFANPPGSPNSYDYVWRGPLGFSSIEEDPIIPNATSLNSGIYEVEITGPTGCKSTGFIEVEIGNTPNQPTIIADNETPCDVDTLLLQAPVFSGQSVRYLWYRGFPPNGNLIGPTFTPSLSVFPPLSSQAYYVEIDVNGCTSTPSSEVTIDVIETPIAEVSTGFIQVCTGNTLSLRPLTVDNRFDYSWTGPSGFVSDLAVPSPFLISNINQAGEYELVVQNQACASLPATTRVQVIESTNRPVIESPGIVCLGDPLVLRTPDLGADFYTWSLPDGSTQITITPILSIQQAALIHGGEWFVTATINNCESEASSSVMLTVSQPPQLTVINNSPVCSNGTVRLAVNEFPGAIYNWQGPQNFQSTGSRVDAPAVGGSYTVTVTDAVGCSAIESTSVAIENTPVITSLSTSNAICVDRSQVVELIATTFPIDDGSYDYSWRGPNGFSSMEARPELPNGDSRDDGIYDLRVTNGLGCTSESFELEVEIINAPEIPMVTGPDQVCLGQAIELRIENQEPDIEFYQWQTPRGPRTTIIPSLIISPSLNLDGGDYQVSANNATCVSDLSSIQEVEVVSGLGRPTITGNNFACEGDSVVLSTQSTAQGIYVWFTPNGTDTTSTAELTISGIDISDGGSYVVQVFAPTCNSDPSSAFLLNVIPKPQTPEITVSVDSLCLDEAGATLILSISSSSTVLDGRYSWFNGSSDSIIGGPTPTPTFTVNDLGIFGEGEVPIYAITSQNGCVSDPSTPDTVLFSNIPSDIAFAGPDLSLCNQTEIRLMGNRPDTGYGTWSILDGVGLQIENPLEPNTLVSNLGDNGSYELIWSLSNGACTDFSTDTLLLMNVSSTEQANAGDDFSDCGEGMSVVSAFPVQNGTGFWTALTIGTELESPDSSTTTVRGLSTGVFAFEWTIEDSLCGFSRDTLFITYEGPPFVQDDVFQHDNAEETEFSVIDNDALPTNYSIELLSPPVLGIARYLDEGTFSYIPPSSALGIDSFSYRVCSAMCPDLCRSATVTVQLVRAELCRVPTIFTPNGDAINDFFVVPCLEDAAIPQNELYIFNQWGDEVFYAAPYVNNWDGTYQGRDLPVGTYFYTLDLNTGNREDVLSGFLIIER